MSILMDQDELKLIEKVQKNSDSKAFEKLFQKYVPVVHAMEREYSIRLFDQDDWIQEGRIVFYKTIENFNDQRNVSLGQYFKRNFRNRIFSLLRFELAYKRKTNVISRSIEEFKDENGEIIAAPVSGENPHSNVILKENLEKYHTQLSSFECEISARLFKGQTPQQIFSEMEYGEHQIRNGLARCRKKFYEQIAEI